MRHQFKAILKKAFNLAGFNLEVRRRIPQKNRLVELLDWYGVDMVFDIGAHTGMSGTELRKHGYLGPIISFEPIGSLYEQCAAIASGDCLWHVERCAVGDTEGEADINVSGGHAAASSLLRMTANVLENEPSQSVVRKERVRLKQLDSLIQTHYPTGDRLFLKIDVQGYEGRVLEGGSGHLNRVIGVKLESSLVENYEGEMLLPDMLSHMYRLGFRPVDIESGWFNKVTQELYQVDVVFFRTIKAASAS